jgi:hypothetical protein
MSTLETALATAAGLALVALAARDIFDALFHPEGRATIGRAVMRTVWRAFRNLPRRRGQELALAARDQLPSETP